MIAMISSAVVVGVEGRPVSVEVHVSNGLPGFTVVGLPDAAVRESRDRVRAALLSSGLTWPLRRVTVNLAPSGMKKTGAGLDLPIAVGVLVASGEIDPAAIDGMAFVGELGLDGALRGVPGAVVLAETLAGSVVVVADADAEEARLPGCAEVRSAPTLRLVVDCLRGRRTWPARTSPRAVAAGRGGGAVGEDRGRGTGVGWSDASPWAVGPPTGDLADVRGQLVARRALEVAAAGGHHLLLVGPPGAGKTMLATRLPGILPPLARSVALEVSKVHSAAGIPLPPGGLIDRPPFRSPHHGASAVSMIGGGSNALRPGEISLAHGGVLFLDELGEFPVAILDALRQPLEEGVVRVSRARGSATLPARLLLVGAMNPCPCGEGTIPGRCRCSPAARARYTRRLSAPLLDRFDLAVCVERPTAEELADASPGEASGVVAGRVRSARRLASLRGCRVNAELPGSGLDRTAPVTPEAAELLDLNVRAGNLSARGLHRVRRIARTIADLDHEAASGGDPGALVDARHVHEALLLRSNRELLLGVS